MLRYLLPVALLLTACAEYATSQPGLAADDAAEAVLDAPAEGSVGGADAQILILDVRAVPLADDREAAAPLYDPNAWQCYVWPSAPSVCAIDCFRRLPSTDGGSSDAGPALLRVPADSCAWPSGFDCASRISRFPGAEPDWCNCGLPVPDGGNAASFLPAGWSLTPSCPPQ